MVNLLKGKVVADAINQRSIETISLLKEKDITPTIAIVRVGENDGDISYEKGATKRANEIGVNVKSVVVEDTINYEKFYQILDELNNDDKIHGILLLRPLPQYLDNEKARCYIDVNKDIDGCSDLSLAGIFTNKELGFAPCTAQAAMEILKYYGIELKGKNACIIGRSLVIGRPISMLLMHENATVTICHTKTKNIKEITKNADIVICASGQMESLNNEYFKDGQTIIDVGISYNDKKQKLCGDVLFEDVENLDINITPVPGGVGSVTTAVLMNHVVNSAYRKVKEN